MSDKTTASVKAAKNPAKDSTTQRYLPFSEIRDNCMIMKDGSSRMVLKVHAVNFNLKSEEEQDAIIIGYQRFLNSLRFPIQIIVRSLKVDIEGYLMKLKNIALKQKNPLLQEQSYRYIDFLTNLIDMAQIMKKDFYIVVPYDADEDKSVRDTGIAGVFRSFWAAITQEETIMSIRYKRQKSESLRKANFERLSTIKTSLESVGIKSDEVKKDELIKLLIGYYNPKVNSESKIKDIEKVNIE
ncbi:hypothetical protein GW819_03070 [Candidatus Gracilibacteria bacterium]|nr:hypothetical protein [bacterium]NDK19796.1 hypothetical protein [Candidatus Gracilibacteria bacterium]OIO77212.1 MAG: hypothetical protein AUJ87_01670 [Candidatus Gracilibacteria bacterium CG1_02_38_174]PIQ10720.1 MAG: hypothetical protein COW68_04010 [Candidatus Gracilibacteria bacterium CG18_big_fil_WC_8_21_14_2_50_38_16]PIQ41612.1 MAG: hypothetical protein COW06_02445 [Candidatus Gracilibacteria bacterium CG12_big_fil_rev_8_21_14_0_65_38_15]PIZ01663.1 MAG: hypothetical protein COY60_0230